MIRKGIGSETRYKNALWNQSRQIRDGNCAIYSKRACRFPPPGTPISPARRSRSLTHTQNLPAKRRNSKKPQRKRTNNTVALECHYLVKNNLTLNCKQERHWHLDIEQDGVGYLDIEQGRLGNKVDLASLH